MEMNINEYLKECKVSKWDELDDEQKERWIEYNNKILYRNGIIDGIRRYSWMKNGTTYVGTTGTTLKKAIEEVEKEYEKIEP